jgi:hypothetical protein
VFTKCYLSVALTEGKIENRGLKKIFGPERKEVM